MWRSVGCRVRGIGHQKLGTPCQDHFYGTCYNNVHVIALADGAGSAKLSHYGSACVVQSAAELMARNFDEIYNCEDAFQIRSYIVDSLLAKLMITAKELDCEIADLASTLLLVAVFEDRYIAVHLGDGVIGYLDGKDLKVASTPDNGEFANVTIFLTSANARTAIRLMKGELKDKSGFVLMSDGTEQSLYHKPTQSLAPIVKKLMHRACLISKPVFEEQLADAFNNVISKQTQDDCSIVFLVKPSEALCPIEQMSNAELNDLLRPDILGDIFKADSVPPYIASNIKIILLNCSQPSSVKDIAIKINKPPNLIIPYLIHLLKLGLITMSETSGNKIFTRVR